jgi:hypothetical protein
MVYVTLLDGPTTNGTITAAASSAFAIAADSAGNAYLAGSTSDPSFPATLSAFQTKLAPANPPANPLALPLTDGFVVKLDPAGSALVWASYLDGISVDQAQSRSIPPATCGFRVSSATDFQVSSGFPNGGKFSRGIQSLRFWPCQFLGCLAVVPAQPQILAIPVEANQDDTVNSKHNPAKVGNFAFHLRDRSSVHTGRRWANANDAADSLRLFHR